MLIRLVVGGVCFEVLAVEDAPRAPPADPADALLTPTIFLDAAAGVRASTKKLVAAFGGIDGPTRGAAADAAAAATAAAAILSSGARPTTPAEVAQSVAAHVRAVVDILRAEYVSRFVAPSRAALEAVAAAAAVDWEHPPALADAAAAVARRAAAHYLWLHRGPAVGTLTYRYRPPTTVYFPAGARPKVRGAASTAAATVTTVTVEHPPPTAAQLRTRTGILWVAELPVDGRRKVVDRVVAAYRVAVAPNRVRHFPFLEDTEWHNETFEYYAAAAKRQARASRGPPPAGGAPPPAPRPGRPPPVPRAKGGSRAHRKRQLVKGSREER